MQKNHTTKKRLITGLGGRIAFYLKNTPHLAENKIVIFLSFFLSGINFILLRLLPGATRFDIDDRVEVALFLLGFIFIGVGFLAVADKRPGMTGTAYTVIVFTLVFLPVSLFLMFLSTWFIAVCFVEISIMISVTLMSISKKVK